MSLDKKIQNASQSLKEVLQRYDATMILNPGEITFTSKDKSLVFLLAGENFNFSESAGEPFVSIDYLINAPLKIANIVLSKLNLNKKVFARNCEIKTIEKTSAETFLNAYHLMGQTTSGSNRGLFYENELLAVASFSKGRKMRRLAVNKRSFELIRFCSKPGITITGGLTKLVKNFYIEKEAGDIMTYVDKQLSDGKSFINAGFKKHSETDPNFFLINRKTLERSLLKNKVEDFDKKIFYLAQNSGNIKMIFKPGGEI